ncbi:MAG: pyruvate kinase [Gammaproteobacteria bacterium]|nr:pyruvate kinase [Gammaproteobacteria bacterium]NCW57177.1 pyruvate kinase [Gammaproteobacteria bacterium]NDB15498.1 pyruvate kinase [Gammaproteobacteria bacterium]NDB24160.1 pyruvate kinase [Gammaproteobacteria bacterium]NDF84953.1 pyruvate kinase [Gammaproteobacteria bacterium]
MRRTKIVATLGPATDELDVLVEMCHAGLDVARINFSHGTQQDHLRRLELLREAMRRTGRYVAVLGDLSGPKIRIESFVAGAAQLVEGQAFALDTALDKKSGNEREVGVAYKELVADVAAGDTLLLNDGLIVLEVLAVQGTRIETRVVAGGELSNRKGLNRKGGGISAPALTDKDREDIVFAAAQHIDYVALSFVRDAEDLHQARALLRAAGGNFTRLVAKIERHEAVAQLAGIIDATDVVMVARGDLGVEMGHAALTGLQKTIIHETRMRNRITITATQMMESMIQNPVPTRAEVSDVANAVLDGTDAVMLSAETATGKYPVKAVAAMAEVIQGAETYHLSQSRPRERSDITFTQTEEAIAHAVMYTANHLNVRAIVALTESGATTLWMSRLRSDIPIYAFTRHEGTRRRVTLYRGVYPVSFDVQPNDDVPLAQRVFDMLLDLRIVDEGDQVILTKGDLSGVQGGTNSMQILRVHRA